MTREEMRRIKEERGYSFRKLSEYSGVPVVTIQKIFSGATENPRKATLDAIERVLSADEGIYQGKAYEYASVTHTDMLRETQSPYGVEYTGKGHTLKDYYALPEEQRVELIDGVFYEMSAPETVHQDIEGYMHAAFYEYIRKTGKPCKVFMAPTDVQICCDDRNMVEPDLLVVCDREKIKGFGIYGAPDFILEILSRSTRKKDMTVKLSKYAEAGVREYWIIDPYKEKLITYDFTDEDYVPCVYPLAGSVPVAISGGELSIDLEPVAESIRELGSL